VGLQTARVTIFKELYEPKENGQKEEQIHIDN
jgi:hypothetical protein